MIDFIVNGKAGYARSWLRTKRIITDKLNEKGVEYRFHFTEYKKHATVLAKEVPATKTGIYEFSSFVGFTETPTACTQDKSNLLCTSSNISIKFFM